MAKKTVFLTGGTGNMGWAAVQEIIKHPNEINLKILARKSPKNEEKLKDLMAKPNVKIVWGDLTDYDSLLEESPALIMSSISAVWYHLLQTGSLTEHKNKYRRCRKHLQSYSCST